MRGGYQLINFNDADLSSAVSEATGVVIDGIYDAIEGTYPGKMIILTGVNTTGSNSLTFPGAPILSGTDFTFLLGSNVATSAGVVTTTFTKVVVTDDDKVYIATETADSTEDS